MKSEKLLYGNSRNDRKGIRTFISVTLQYWWVVGKKRRKDCKVLLVPTNQGTTRPVIKDMLEWSIKVYGVTES